VHDEEESKKFPMFFTSEKTFKPVLISNMKLWSYHRRYLALVVIIVIVVADLTSKNEEEGCKTQNVSHGKRMLKQDAEKISYRAFAV
jgi:hypothetical protein